MGGVGGEPPLLIDDEPQPIEGGVQRRGHLSELGFRVLDRDSRVESRQTSRRATADPRYLCQARRR